MKTIFIAVVSALSLSAAAQPSTIYTSHQPVGEIYIRGLRYQDHSRNASLHTASLVNGGTLAISCGSLNFSQLNNRGYRFSVVLQDVNRPNGYGVTVFQLRSLRVSGNRLFADVPFDASYNYLKNRSSVVTVFVIGPQPWHYVHAGTISLY